MHILVNDFAIRSFRETADKDYITARMAYRARLIQPFRWAALHCLEKFVKGILLLNRVDAKKLNHSVLPGIERMKLYGKFELDLSIDTVKFIQKLEESGAEDRYYLVSYDIEPFDIARLDRAVWEIRRYCQPLDYVAVDTNGNTVNCLPHELDRVHRAKEKNEKGTCIEGGILEKIVAQKNHPAREALIWNNLFFGASRRKGVKLRPDWEAGNSPFFLYPEILDEVIKYVNVPGNIAEGVRQFAQQKAVENTKSEKQARVAARKSGKPG
jgi:hypothetical protein